VRLTLYLVGGSLIAWAVAVAASPASLPAASAGLAVVLPPAVLTLVLVDAVGRRQPQAGPAAAMVATGMRMGWAVVAVSVLGTPAESVGIPRQSLADWACGFYLVTLALDTAVLWGRLDRPVGGPR
jgi:hypothetical protein